MNTRLEVLLLKHIVLYCRYDLLVKLPPCDREVTGSNRGNKLLHKCRLRLHTINPCGSAFSQNPHIAGVLVHWDVVFFSVDMIK